MSWRSETLQLDTIKTGAQKEAAGGASRLFLLLAGVGCPL